MACVRDTSAGSWRRRRRTLLAVVVLAPLLATLAYAADEVPIFRIGTASTTGTYFQIGGVLAGAISKPTGTRDCGKGGGCGVPGLVAVAEATQGSVENVLAVSDGQLESALAQSDVAYWAYTGSWAAPHGCHLAAPSTGRAVSIASLKSRGPLSSLRAIAGLYPEDIHVVVRANSTIHSILDLRGKRVALGEPESGTLADARLVLEAAGVSECELKPQYLTLSQAAAALEAGEIDAFFQVAGSPVPAIADLAVTVPIRLLPIAGEPSLKLTRGYRFFTTDVIAAGSYNGIDEPVPTIAVTALWTVGAQVPDNLVYAITEALWRNAALRRLAGAHPAGRRIALANALTGMVIPLHPGAARYYMELGMTLPAQAH